MNSHDLARKILELPDAPLEWGDITFRNVAPYSLKGAVTNIELTTEEEVPQWLSED